jgi:hypothetical protein
MDIGQKRIRDLIPLLPELRVAEIEIRMHTADILAKARQSSWDPAVFFKIYAEACPGAGFDECVRVHHTLSLEAGLFSIRRTRVVYFSASWYKSVMEDNFVEYAARLAEGGDAAAWHGLSLRVVKVGMADLAAAAGSAN